MNSVIKRLEKYAEMEGTEVGEYWKDLCRLTSHDDIMPKKLYWILMEEIRDQLDFIKDNMEVVEEEYPGFGTIRELRDKC